MTIARDTWMKMLTQIQGITASKAATVIKYFPTILSLAKAYSEIDDPVDAKVRTGSFERSGVFLYA